MQRVTTRRMCWVTTCKRATKGTSTGLNCLRRAQTTIRRGYFASYDRGMGMAKPTRHTTPARPSPASSPRAAGCVSWYWLGLRRRLQRDASHLGDGGEHLDVEFRKLQHLRPQSRAHQYCLVSFVYLCTPYTRTAQSIGSIGRIYFRGGLL
eukprot:4427904-Pyramimonas_sp.AAC.1